MTKRPNCVYESVCASTGNGCGLVLLSFCGLTCFITNSAQRPQGKTMMVPCDTEYPAFVSERTIKETTGNIDCDGCIRYCLWSS